MGVVANQQARGAALSIHDKKGNAVLVLVVKDDVVTIRRPDGHTVLDLVVSQAAGIAAAMCAEKDCAPMEMDFLSIRKIVESRGAELDIAD